MDSFLPGYRDPIFSIIIILLIILAISVASYGWSVYKEERLKKSLFGFIDRFDSGTCSLDEENMVFDKSMIKPLVMLAKAYEKSGEYDKSISICLYLIRHTNDDELMIYLGKVYMRAGFLQRSKDIFEELISRHPRRKDILYSLESLYEKTGDTESALEALDALEAQGENVSAIRRFLKLKNVLSDRNMIPVVKKEAIIETVNDDITIFRMGLRHLFAIDPVSAWSLLKDERVEDVIDILWLLPYSQLHLDIIKSSKKLEAVYFARGDLEEYSEESGIFAVDMLCASRRGGYSDGDLEFSYLCRECKRSFPISFDRCPGCMAINSIEIEESLEKRRDERGETLL